MEHISQEGRSDHKFAQNIVLETMSWQSMQKFGVYLNERLGDILISIFISWDQFQAWLKSMKARMMK